MARTFLRNAQVFDGNRLLAGRSVVVVDGERLAFVGTESEAPAPAPEDRVVDVAGRTVMPGMVFCHFHAAYDNISSFQDIDLKHPPTYATLIAARNAEMMLRCGYTSAVGAGSAHYIDVALKKAQREGLINAPRMFACGRDVVTTGDSVDNHPRWWRLGLDGLASVCDGPDEFRKAVREEIRNGVDIVKTYPTGGHGVPLPETHMSMTEAEIEAAVEAAHGRQAKIRGHVVNKRGILACVRAGMDLLDHADGLDAECIEAMAPQGTFVAPSLYFSWRTVQRNADKPGPVRAHVREAIETVERMAKALPEADAAGVRIVMGDDFGAAGMEHGNYARELNAYVEGAGAPSLDVLRWATRNGAELMGRGHELGTLEAGKLADLLVVDGDPVANIRVLEEPSNLAGVCQSGRLIVDNLAALR